MYIATALILFLSLLAVLLRKLSPAAGVAGALVAAGLYLGLGYAGLGLLGAFFVLGTAATSYRNGWKEEQGLREGLDRAGPQRGRTAVQVWANGGVAALCALGAAFARDWQRSECAPDYLWARLLCLMAAAALSAATADTLASELGNAWGRRYINIRSLRPDSRGRDGAISIEGTLAGLAGSAIIALLYCGTVQPGVRAAFVLLAAGTFGNLADSWLGATLQQRGRLSNDGVNLLNTLLAALFAGALGLLARAV
ncbi:DUF92 domain-containing protein [Flaviaesturariibacter terrae]